MTIQEFVDCTGATLVTKKGDPAREITSGYACDLLSWVMSHGQAGMAWITVQTHMNVVAVATLMEMALVVAPEGIAFDQEVIDKADEEGVQLAVCGKTAYHISGLLYQAGVPAK